MGLSDWSAGFGGAIVSLHLLGVEEYVKQKHADYNSEETDQVIPAVSYLQGGVFHACHGTQPLPQEYDRRP